MVCIRKPDRINYEFDYVLGQVLKAKRTSKGYSLQYVADKLGTTKQAIFRYEKAEVKQIRIHDFRHSCASFLIQNGASIVLVSKYLGHSKISITLDTYTHLYENELKKVSNLIDTL